MPCSLCGLDGHNITTCPNQDHASRKTHSEKNQETEINSPASKSITATTRKSKRLAPDDKNACTQQHIDGEEMKTASPVESGETTENQQTFNPHQVCDMSGDNPQACSKADPLLDQQKPSGHRRYTRHCKVCGNTGHNLKTCPKVCSPSEASTTPEQLHEPTDSTPQVKTEVVDETAENLHQERSDRHQSLTESDSSKLSEEAEISEDSTSDEQIDVQLLTDEQGERGSSFEGSSSKPSHSRKPSALKGLPKHCRNCGSVGHTITTCSFLKYLPPQEQGKTYSKCSICGCAGHAESLCITIHPEYYISNRVLPEYMRARKTLLKLIMPNLRLGDEFSAALKRARSKVKKADAPKCRCCTRCGGVGHTIKICPLSKTKAVKMMSLENAETTTENGRSPKSEYGVRPDTAPQKENIEPPPKRRRGRPPRRKVEVEEKDLAHNLAEDNSSTETVSESSQSVDDPQSVL